MSEYLIPAAQGLLALAMLAVAILLVRLDRKLAALRAGKDGVAQAAADLTGAVTRAEAAVRTLKGVSDGAAADLQKRIAEAQGVAEALKFLSTTARAAQETPREPVRQAPRPAHRDDWTRDEPLFDDLRAGEAPARRDPPGGGRWGGLR